MTMTTQLQKKSRGRHLRGIMFWALVLNFLVLTPGVFLFTTDHARASSFTNKEQILNGGFEQGARAWLVQGVGSGVRASVGPDACTLQPETCTHFSTLNWH